MKFQHSMARVTKLEKLNKFEKLFTSSMQGLHIPLQSASPLIRKSKGHQVEGTFFLFWDVWKRKFVPITDSYYMCNLRWCHPAATPGTKHRHTPDYNEMVFSPNKNLCNMDRLQLPLMEFYTIALRKKNLGNFHISFDCIQCSKIISGVCAFTKKGKKLEKRLRRNKKSIYWLEER